MENIFIILLGLTMIYISATSRLTAHVNMLVAQGWLLFFICLTGFSKEDWFNFAMFENLQAFTNNVSHIIALLFVFIETLIVKAIVIPIFLRKVLKKTHAHRDTDANIPHFYALFISSIILFAGFMGVSTKTVEAWEAGRNMPDGPARRILAMLKVDPGLPQRLNIVAK